MSFLRKTLPIIEPEKPWWQRYSKPLALLVLVILIILGGWYVARPTSPQQPSQNVYQELQQVADRSVHRIKLGDADLTVEVVNTPQSIQQGLSNREGLRTHGMLFVLPRREVATFWMYQMKFDLDLIWIDKGEVVGIERQVPAPKRFTLDSQLPVYQSPQAVELVLEVPAGHAREWGLVVGDQLEL